MFKPREFTGFGQAAPLAVAAAIAPAAPGIAAGDRSFRTLLARARAIDLAGVDWAPDLAEQIGSRRWFRGLATMLGLMLAALSLWPDTAAIAAPPAMPLDSNAREEFRSQMIQPLALGGDSGRHMAPTAQLVRAAAMPQRNSVRFTATLGQGDSLEYMLARAGLNGVDTAAVSRLVGAVIPAGQIVPGTQFDIALGSHDGGARLLEHLAFRARFALDLTIARGGGELRLQQQAIAVDTTPLRIRGTVAATVE